MQTSQPSAFRKIGIFIGHQIFATIGVMLGTTLVATIAFPIARYFDHSISMRSVHWVLTETPYFPLQILEGLIAGYLGYWWFKHASACWVWIVPLLWLATWFFFWSPPSVIAEKTWMMRINHFFGDSCNPAVRCFDQLVTTLPFYASLAYAAGAYTRKSGLFQFEQPDSGQESEQSN